MCGRAPLLTLQLLKNNTLWLYIIFIPKQLNIRPFPHNKPGFFSEQIETLNHWRVVLLGVDFWELSIHLATTPGTAIPHVLLQISHLLHKTCHPHAPPVGPGNKKWLDETGSPVTEAVDVTWSQQPRWLRASSLYWWDCYTPKKWINNGLEYTCRTVQWISDNNKQTHKTIKNVFPLTEWFPRYRP